VCQIKRLLKHMEELLEHDPAYRKQQEKANRTQSLHSRLIALRDTEINAAFPDTPAEKGLLNPNLLNEFVQKPEAAKDKR
jgi:hypothetical protein